MSTNPPNQPSSNLGPSKDPASSSSAPPAAVAEATMDTAPDQPAEETWEDIPDDVLNSTTDEIFTRIRLIENDIKVCFQNFTRALTQLNDR